MEFKASLKYIRISPRKTRLVADQIRGKNVGEALDILRFSKRRASSYLIKLLKSAIANAENYEGENDVDLDNLYIKKIYINEGPRYKRIFYRAFGRASMKLRRMSHMHIMLDDKKE
jgi:large subunit ribosomal protein L22